MATIRLIELALIGYRKNYVVEFQKGFNYILEILQLVKLRFLK